MNAETQPSIMSVIMLPGGRDLDGQSGFNGRLQNYLESKYPGQQKFIHVDARYFANGEAYSQLRKNVRGSHSYVVQASSGSYSFEPENKRQLLSLENLLTRWKVIETPMSSRLPPGLPAKVVAAIEELDHNKRQQMAKILYGLTGLEVSAGLSPRMLTEFMRRRRTQFRSVNDHFMGLLVTLNTVKLAGARIIDPVLPWIPYMRQDRKAAPRTPISARLIADLIECAAGNKLGSVLTAELHVPQAQGFFNVPVDNLLMARLFAADIRATMGKYELNPEHSFIISPDLGGEKRAEAVAKILGLSVIFCKKDERVSGNQYSQHEILIPFGFDVTRFKGGTGFLIDDLGDSCYTLSNVSRDVKNTLGIETTVGYVTHGVLSAKAPGILQLPHLDHVAFADTLEPTTPGIEAVFECGKASTIGVYHLFGEAMRANALPQDDPDGSVSKLFEPGEVERLSAEAKIPLGRTVPALEASRR